MTLKMSVSVIQRNDVLGAGIRTRVANLERAVKAARQSAAKTATAASLSHVKRVRPLAPQRPGRNDESIEKVLRWRGVGTGADEAGVGINLSELNSKSPHWIVQEIGTGQRATMKVADKPNPQGRPTEGATYIRTVKSQKGRRISSGLVFATGPSGQWTRPGAGSGQQLYLRRQVKGVPATRTRSQAGIVIRNEIKGQHFVKQGGEAGFREYRESVLAAARSQFRKGRG